MTEVGKDFSDYLGWAMVSSLSCFLFTYSNGLCQTEKKMVEKEADTESVFKNELC